MGLFSKKNKSASTSSHSSSNSHLTISVDKNNAVYTIFLEGRLDTLTSPDLELKVKEALGDAKKLVFDLYKLEYISSAGLRVLLGAAQGMEGKGEMVVCHLNQTVQEIFDITGFSNIFNIE